MTEIFISYARTDRPIAARIAASLREQDWEVFWDRNIEAGAEWNDEIQRNLSLARCVLVLWSKASQDSFWVAGEAARAFDRGSYLPVQLDGSEQPRLFRHVQALGIGNWVEHDDSNELDLLKKTIKSRIGGLPGYGNLERVADGVPVREAHLHLVHSCWRVDKLTRYGVMPYQIHIILYGHPSALARVESVEYYLPGYPSGHEHQKGGPPDRLFELKELANGFSIVQAHVHLHSQPQGHPRTLHLSRFINMAENGPRLGEYIRRRPPE